MDPYDFETDPDPQNNKDPTVPGRKMIRIHIPALQYTEIWRPGALR